MSFISSGCNSNPEAAEPQIIPVKLQKAETITIVDSSEFVGTLKAGETVNLTAPINGRIVKILVNKRQRVTRGNPIMHLESEEQSQNLNLALIEASSQGSQLKITQADVKKMEAEKDRFAVGLEQIKAEIRNLEAEIELAQRNLNQSEFLVQSGALAQKDLHEQTEELENKLVELDTKNKALKRVQDSLQIAENQVKQARLNLARQKTAVASSQIKLSSIGQKKISKRLSAPITGMLGYFRVNVGDYVRIGQQVTTITPNDTLEMTLKIPVTYSSKLKNGLSVEIINSDETLGVKGKISSISANIEQQNQTIPTKITFRNNGSLRDEQFVRVRVIWDQQPGFLIPMTAVANLGEQKFVFVAEKEKSEDGNPMLVAKQKSVTVAGIQDRAYQITSGVESGDSIVLSRIFELFDGTPISEDYVNSQQTIKN
ncbi:MAG: efflux RND transporter periplasmic adaptor subunit [Moorea sp. SIO2B7]|nr:efflux RND transporter periplasmic adaptor subunit [Moorena sp. SIO2B7]